MKDEVKALCDQITTAVNSVYVKGCDDIAMNNLAQLRGIWQSAQRIKQLMKEVDKDA